jgi:Uma2 family endonuclease
MSTALADPPAAPPRPTLTPDDLLRLPDQGKGYELVDGELKELNVSTLSSYTAGEIYYQLRNHVTPRRLGWVFPEGTSFRCFPDDPARVRRADTAFHALARLSPASVAAEGHCPVVPDLVVEVVSPNDLADDVAAKRVEWLAAGAKLVWVVFPVQREVHAFGADGAYTFFRAADELTAAPLLPDFRTPVAGLFELPTAPAAAQ